MNQFMTDEYVLAYHGPLLYEARVSLTLVPNLSSLVLCTETEREGQVADVGICADEQILLAENWTEQNTLLGTVGPHYFIHYKGWKQT